jgi:hypothetical protein
VGLRQSLERVDEHGDVSQVPVPTKRLGFIDRTRQATLQEPGVILTAAAGQQAQEAETDIVVDHAGVVEIVLDLLAGQIDGLGLVGLRQALARGEHGV